MGTSPQGGKGGRKFGRSKRGNSMAYYNSVRKDKINKARVAKKLAKEKAKKATRNTTPRGTARAAKREDMTAFKNLRRWLSEKRVVKTLVTVHYTKDREHSVSKRI